MSAEDAREPTDEDWDVACDAELTALGIAEEVRPAPPRPWVAPPHDPPPTRVFDRQVVVLDGESTVGEFLRACRASAGLSQRGLAQAAGVPQSTVSRIEAGRVDDVKLATVVRLAAACDVSLVGTTVSTAPTPALLETDLAQRHRDGGTRWLPAHLVNRPRDPSEPAEWVFPRYDRPLPRRRFSHGRGVDARDDDPDA